MRRLALLLLPMLALAGDPPKVPELAVESYTLPNGLKVALHRDPSVPRVTVAVAYHVGSKNESAGRTGFAHFFEHMMFRGTKNVPNYDIPLQETGAQTNAFTSEDMTVYYEAVPSEYLERALYLEAERLAFLPSALDKAKFDTEREVVKNERRQSYENQPYGLAEETILANVFPKGHPYSWSVIGSMKDLNNATIDDLKRFFAEFYHPANATLVLAGDFDPVQAKALIAKYFSPLAAGPRPKVVTAPMAKATAKKIAMTDKVQLPRVYWAWPTVADDHPDSPALDLLSYVLAGGEASRMHKALVRDARISKDVSADSDTKEAAGFFQVQSTAAEDSTKLAAIEAILAKEIAAIQQKAPSEAELSRALARHESSSIESLTQPLARAVILGTGLAQYDDANHYRKDYARYFTVKPDDLSRVAKTYLTPEKVVLYIEPMKAGSSPSTAVQAGPLGTSDVSGKIAERVPAKGPDWTKLPASTAPRDFKAPKFVKRTLKNGMSVWIAPWKTLPVVSARLLIPGGTADDPEGKAGLATLTAKMMEQGTKSKTATELAEAFDALGATFGFSIDSDQTTLSVQTLARHLDPTLKLVGELLATPRFDGEDFSREKSLQLASLKQGPDSVPWIATRVFRSLLNGGDDHPYGNPADGYVASVNKLALEDVKAFHRANLGPKGAILIVAGDVEPDALIAKLDAALNDWPAQKAEPKPRTAPKTKAEAGVVYFVDKPGAVQSSVYVGRLWVDRKHESYLATMLGNRMLGADFLSRLNQNLRETNGFTYGAGSMFRFRQVGSVWAVATQVRTDVTAAALKEVFKELDDLATGKRPFTVEETATATDAEIRSYPEGFESPASIAAVLEEMAEFDLPDDYLDTYLANLKATKREAVSDAMAKVVDSTSRIVLVVGDRKSVEPKLKELGFKTVRVLNTDGKPAE
jgi:zinc protease